MLGGKDATKPDKGCCFSKGNSKGDSGNKYATFGPERKRSNELLYVMRRQKNKLIE